jgi:hypothetical protein
MANAKQKRDEKQAGSVGCQCSFWPEWACLEKTDTESGGYDVWFFVFEFKGHR